MSADLSVVICSLNGAAGVDRCLRALADQKDVELQVIVVDDGSTDDTSEVGRERGATAERAGRIVLYLPTSSATKCCASAALPPFPQTRILFPALRHCWAKREPSARDGSN